MNTTAATTLPRASIVTAAAVFLSSYLTFRPVESIMFTASDVLFIFTITALAITGRFPLRPFGDLSPVWLCAVGLMLAGLLAGSLTSSDPDRWSIVAVQYTFAWIVLPSVLIGHGRLYTTTLVKYLVAGAVVMEVVGALVYFLYTGSFQSARHTFGLDFLTGGRRLGAFTADANWNGAVVAMALPFVYYLYFKRIIGKLIAAASALALLLGLLLSASFTAFTSAATALPIYAVVGGLRLDWKVLVAAVLLVGVGLEAGYELPAVFQKRVGNALESGNIEQAGTFGGRVALIRNAWELAQDNMIVGVGADQFRVVSPLKAPVHNMYLLLWVEGGLISLIGWFGMLGVLLASALSAFRRDRLAAATSLSVLSTFIVFSTASPHMYARMWPVPVLLAVAIALQTSRSSRPAKASKNGDRSMAFGEPASS